MVSLVEATGARYFKPGEPSGQADRLRCHPDNTAKSACKPQKYGGRRNPSGNRSPSGRACTERALKKGTTVWHVRSGAVRWSVGSSETDDTRTLRALPCHIGTDTSGGGFGEFLLGFCQAWCLGARSATALGRRLRRPRWPVSWRGRRDGHYAPAGLAEMAGVSALAVRRQDARRTTGQPASRPGKPRSPGLPAATGETAEPRGRRRSTA